MTRQPAARASSSRRGDWLARTISRGNAVCMSARAPDIAILFEDPDLVAVAKPSGLPTANAARGADSLYHWLIRRPSTGRREAATPSFVGIVSRLDAPVSGVVVAARNPTAAADLAEQFRSRTVQKEYAALVAGRFPGAVGEWREWHDTLARRADERCSRVRIGGTARDPTDSPAHDDWKTAHLRARVVRRGGEVSLVELLPSTGRRHQLRAQLAARGCPIVGDRAYGSRLPFPDGIALHARRLTLRHPRTGEPLQLTADWPATWLGRYRPLLTPPAP